MLKSFGVQSPALEKFPLSSATLGLESTILIEIGLLAS